MSICSVSSSSSAVVTGVSSGSVPSGYTTSSVTVSPSDFGSCTISTGTNPELLKKAWDVEYVGAPETVTVLGRVYTAVNNRPSFKFTPKYAVPAIKEIIVNPPVTVVLWLDDTKTVSRPEEGEEYDMYTGFMACVCKKLFGSVSAAKRVFEKYNTTLEKEKRRREKEEAKARNAAREKTARERKHRRLVKEYAEKIKAHKEAAEIVNGKE